MNLIHHIFEKNDNNLINDSKNKNSENKNSENNSQTSHIPNNKIIDAIKAREVRSVNYLNKELIKTQL